MPLGKDGKIVSGRLICLLWWSQKQRGHSFRSARAEGDSLYVDIFASTGIIVNCTNNGTLYPAIYYLVNLSTVP